MIPPTVRWTRVVSAAAAGGVAAAVAGGGAGAIAPAGALVSVGLFSAFEHPNVMIVMIATSGVALRFNMSEPPRWYVSSFFPSSQRRFQRAVGLDRTSRRRATPEPLVIQWRRTS